MPHLSYLRAVENLVASVEGQDAVAIADVGESGEELGSAEHRWLIDVKVA